MRLVVDRQTRSRHRNAPATRASILIHRYYNNRSERAVSRSLIAAWPTLNEGPLLLSSSRGEQHDSWGLEGPNRHAACNHCNFERGPA